mgnify:CR=1 FL=1
MTRMAKMQDLSVDTIKIKNGALTLFTYKGGVRTQIAVVR